MRLFFFFKELILTHTIKVILPSSHIPSSSPTTICSASVVHSYNRVLETVTASARLKARLSLLWHASYCTQRKNLQLILTTWQARDAQDTPTPWFQSDTGVTQNPPGSKEVGWAHRAAGSTHGHPAALTAPQGMYNRKCVTHAVTLKSKSTEGQHHWGRRQSVNCDKAHSTTKVSLPYRDSSGLLSLAHTRHSAESFFQNTGESWLLSYFKNGTLLTTTCNRVEIIHFILKITKF